MPQKSYWETKKTPTNQWRYFPFTTKNLCGDPQWQIAGANIYKIHQDSLLLSSSSLVLWLKAIPTLACRADLQRASLEQNSWTSSPHCTYFTCWFLLQPNSCPLPRAAWMSTGGHRAKGGSTSSSWGSPGRVQAVLYRTPLQCETMCKEVVTIPRFSVEMHSWSELKR